VKLVGIVPPLENGPGGSWYASVGRGRRRRARGVDPHAAVLAHRDARRLGEYRAVGEEGLEGETEERVPVDEQVDAVQVRRIVRHRVIEAEDELTACALT
jgi:hypothetical protein